MSQPISPTKRVQHEIESAISVLEGAFYGTVENPKLAQEYKNLFEQTIKSLRQINEAIIVEGYIDDKTKAV